MVITAIYLVPSNVIDVRNNVANKAPSTEQVSTSSMPLNTWVNTSNGERDLNKTLAFSGELDC